MICNLIDKDFFIIKVFNDIYNFDIYDHNEIKEFVNTLFKKLLNKYNIYGNVLINIYIDNVYGMIVEIKKEDNLFIKKFINIKIKFNLNISFLYDVDYFYLLDNNINNQNIYYYNNKFYLEIINDIDKDTYIKLLDNSLIIYNEEINNIINNGIKLIK